MLQTETKSCAVCGEEQPLEAYPSQAKPREDRRGQCRKCVAAAAKRWRRENPEKARRATRAWREKNLERHREMARDGNARKLYGLTLAEYKRLKLRGCDICGRAAGTGQRGMHIDHDHVTGVVRGVLCATCNIGVGHFKDDPALLREAAAYLEGSCS